MMTLRSGESCHVAPPCRIRKAADPQLMRLLNRFAPGLELEGHVDSLGGSAFAISLGVARLPSVCKGTRETVQINSEEQQPRPRLTADAGWADRSPMHPTPFQSPLATC